MEAVREIRSPRTVGLLVLLVPVAVFVALSRFPSYDARPGYFRGTYPKIIEAGSEYLLSLVLLLLIPGLLAALALTLRRNPQSDRLGGLTGLIAVPAFGFGSAALLGIPVWIWADQVADGRLSLADGASKSEALASSSQTLILLVGLGGLLLVFSMLGVLAYRLAWIPRVVFWVAFVLSAGALVVGFAVALFWFALGLPPIIWTLMIGGSLIGRRSWPSGRLASDNDLF